MSEVATLLLAAAAAAGAWCAIPVPLLVGLVPLVAGMSMRVAWLAVIGVLVLSSGLAARAWSGLDPAPHGGVEGEVTLVTDPEILGSGVSAEVTFEGRHYQAELPPGPPVRDLLAGEHLTIRGRLEPLTDSNWLRYRHVAGRLVVDRITETRDAAVVHRAANRIRRLLARGWSGLPPDERALLAGMVLGDDRGQSPLVADDFRAAGLSHLLAVSGQNVAFVLSVIAPVARRMGRWSRLLLSVAVLAFFALMTRFEPSVLRATVMAALATAGVAGGRQLGRWRPLALAVTLLLLIDPLLVHSVGFRLSVAASAGILAWAGRVADRVPGPEPLRSAVGVAVAAQAGVAPLVVTAFGGTPLLAVPANLLAAPVVGPVMVWGMTGGLLAGIVDPVLAAAIHQPSRLMLAWVLSVARWAAGLPAVELAVPHLVLVAMSLGAGRLCRRLRWGVPAAVARVGLLSVLAAAALRGPPPLAFGAEPIVGLRVWTEGSVTVLAVDGGVSVGRALRSMRESGVRDVDLLVVESTGEEAEEVAAALLERHRSAWVWGPRGVDLPGLVPPPPSGVRLGDLFVAVRRWDRGIEVSVVHPDGTGLASERAPPSG